MSAALPVQSQPKGDRSLLPSKAQMTRVLPKQEQRLQVTEQASGADALNPQELAAVLLDQALILWGDDGETKVVAAALGVSASLVGKWRRTDERESPSLTQLVSLGSEFLGLFSKVEGRYHRRAEIALMELATAVGNYARHREGR